MCTSSHNFFCWFHSFKQKQFHFPPRHSDSFQGGKQKRIILNMLQRYTIISRYPAWYSGPGALCPHTISLSPYPEKSNTFCITRSRKARRDNGEKKKSEEAAAANAKQSNSDSRQFVDMKTSIFYALNFRTIFSCHSFLCRWRCFRPIFPIPSKDGASIFDSFFLLVLPKGQIIDAW